MQGTFLAIVNVSKSEHADSTAHGGPLGVLHPTQKNWNMTWSM